MKRDHFVFFHRAKKNTFGIFDYVAFFGWMVNADGLAHTFLGKVLSKFAYFWTIEDWKKNSRPHSVTQHSTLLARLLGRWVRIPPAERRDSMPKWRETASQNLNKEAPLSPFARPPPYTPCLFVTLLREKKSATSREHPTLLKWHCECVSIILFFSGGLFERTWRAAREPFRPKCHILPHTHTLSLSLYRYMY